jgi:hypothetical protein
MATRVFSFWVARDHARDAAFLLIAISLAAISCSVASSNRSARQLLMLSVSIHQQTKNLTFA